MTAPNSAPSIEDFLNQGGGKSFKFENIGDTITGTISNQKLAPQYEFDGKTQKSTDTIRTNDDGSTVYQLVLTLETELRDPANPEDDGLRNVYLASWRQREALTKALRAAGVRKTEIGAQVTITHTGLEERTAENKNRSLAKEYTVSYTPKGHLLDVGSVATETPAPAVAAAPAPAAANPLAGLGLSPEVLAQIAAAQAAQAAPPAPAPAPAPEPTPAPAPAPQTAPQAVGGLDANTLAALKALGIG